MDKKFIFMIANALFEALLLPKVIAEYMMAGYRAEMIVAAIVGIVIGAILFIQYPVKKAIYWILVGVVLISLQQTYDYLLVHANRIPPLEAWAMLLMIFLFCAGLSYLLLAFEIWVVAIFNKKEE